jgi:hypothetical protein
MDSYGIQLMLSRSEVGSGHHIIQVNPLVLRDFSIRIVIIIDSSGVQLM